MATNTLPSLSLSSFFPRPKLVRTPSPLSTIPLHAQCHISTLTPKSPPLSLKLRGICFVAEEVVGGEAPVAGAEIEGVEQPVSVPVSPSDLLTMFFQAEGTMIETAIPTITSTLQLTKKTTIQATGVASNLVEIIQGSGFKLQTLNLSFDDEEEVLVA